MDDVADHSAINQADRLKTLNEIGRAVSSSLDLRTLYDTIFQQVGRVMDASLFVLCLMRSERGVIEIPYMREEGKLYVDEQLPEGNSVSALVIERGTPLLFNTDKEYRDYVRENGLPDLTVGEHIPESMIFMPLHTGDRTIGALSVQSLRRYAYTEDDVQMLSVIASQAAVAIVNAALYQHSQDNVRQMHALLRVARTVNSSLDLQSVLDAILVGIHDVLPYYLAVIFLPNQKEQVLEIKGSAGLPADKERIDSLRDTVKIPFGSGVTGTAFAMGEPVIAGNVEEYPGTSLHGATSGSELAVPLKRGEHVVGVLDVEREQVDAFSQADLHLVSLFASQAAIAIENARLYGSQQQRVEELATIQAIVQRLSPLQDIPTIASVIDSELKHLIDYHAARLFFLDASRQVLVPLVTSGVDVSGIQLQIGEGLAGWIAMHGEPVIVPNSLADPRVTHIPGTPTRAESVIGAPLIFEDRVQGVITLSQLGTDQFDENALRLLQIVAGQAAIVVHRARLYDQLRTDAITDPLTQLYNRRYLIERLKEEQARAGRSRHEVAAIMLDLDKFKQVNDRYGHDAGDAVLQAMAGIIRAVVRTEDIVARYGGEEFCVLLPDVEPGEAEQVAERLRAMIEKTRLPEAAGIRQMTVSVGVARLAAEDQATELVTRADAAMYRGKRVGGNVVVIADDGELRVSRLRAS